MVPSMSTSQRNRLGTAELRSSNLGRKVSHQSTDDMNTDT
jgi:hypothetical protein